MVDLESADIRAGDRRALAKAITLIESTRPKDQRVARTLLEELLPHTGRSLRIGISGSPGVGKSTFIEALGLHALDHGQKIAVLAVDPSSPRSGGSILGDKTRMQQLAQRSDAFIRPSPAAETQGGVAHATRECILLCEAASFDTVFVETVGTGQSEYEVARMVDFFVVLILPNSGDELQGIKRGLIELADALVINKADGLSTEQAAVTRSQFQNAIQMVSPHSFWAPPVLECSALYGSGIDEIWRCIESFHEEALKNGHLLRQRAEQNADWLRTLFSRAVHAQASEKAGVRAALQEMERKVIAGTTTPYAALQKITELL